MCAAGEQLEHSLRVAHGLRLAEHGVIGDDDCVDAENRPAAAVDRPRLARSVFDRVVALLREAWCDDGSGFFSLRVMPFRKRIGGLDAFIHPAQAFEDYGSPRLVDRVFGGFKSGTEGE